MKYQSETWIHAASVAMLGAGVLASCVTPLHGPQPTYSIRMSGESNGWTAATVFGAPALLENRSSPSAIQLSIRPELAEHNAFSPQVSIEPPHPLRLVVCAYTQLDSKPIPLVLNATPIVVVEGSDSNAGRPVNRDGTVAERLPNCSRWEFQIKVSDNWPGITFGLLLSRVSLQGRTIDVPAVEIAVKYDRVFECVGVRCPLMH